MVMEWGLAKISLYHRSLEGDDRCKQTDYATNVSLTRYTNASIIICVIDIYNLQYSTKDDAGELRV